MTTDELSIGVDRQGESVFVAHISHAAGRPIIEYLGEARSADDVAAHHAQVRRSYSVSEPDTVIKHIRVGANETYVAAQRAHFELVQSLLDNEQDFAIDILPSHSREQFIGVALRRTDLHAHHTSDTTHLSGFQVRAIALAKGFSAFCDHSHGDFHCVLDVTKTGISIAFLYQGQIARIGYMARLDTSVSEAACKALAGDLKTALSYHGETLFHEGITVPLSGIHMSVDDADQPLVAAMRQYSHVPLQVPVVNRFSLGPNVNVATDRQHRYLTALGLALE